jgi:beta-phosphoglucomutase-like phosphatase (HAD superfamily)
MPLEALIWDVDGTLAETEEGHRAAFNAAFADAGLDWHWDPTLYARLLDVTGGKERIRHYLETTPDTPKLDDPTIAQLHAAKTAHYVAAIAAGTVALRPGVHRLLHEAQAAGLRLAIATTTTPANVDALLHATLGPTGPAMFETIAAGDMVPRKKPAPDIYDLVLARLRLPATHCLAIEDTPNGAQSARAAGIPVLITTSLYGGTEGFGPILQIVDSLDAPMIDLAALHRLHANPSPPD